MMRSCPDGVWVMRESTVYSFCFCLPRMGPRVHGVDVCPTLQVIDVGNVNGSNFNQMIKALV